MCRLTPASTSAARAVQLNSLRAILTTGSSVIERHGNGIKVAQVTFGGGTVKVGEHSVLAISFSHALSVARECGLDIKGMEQETKVYFRREDEEVTIYPNRVAVA